MRVKGPYLAMLTIAFGFIVEHGLIEGGELTGGQNGLVVTDAPTLFGAPLSLLIVLVALSLGALYVTAWGRVEALWKKQPGEQSLEALAPFGRLVHYGQAGREGAPALDPGRLMGTSRGVLGFWLVHLLRRPQLLSEAMADMLAAVVAGDLEPVVGGTYPLAEARRAHEDLRARRTTGKLVLVP